MCPPHRPAPGPGTGSGRPSLCALAGPVLKPGLDPGSSCSPHPPTLSSTHPDPDAGTHPFSRPPPPRPSLPGLQLYLPSEHQPTRAPHHGAGHSPSPSRPCPLPHQGGPSQARPEGVLGPPQGGAGKEALPRGTGSAKGSVPTPRRGKRRGAGTLAGPGRPRLTWHRAARRDRHSLGCQLPPFWQAAGLCQPSQPSRAPGPVPSQFPLRAAWLYDFTG